MTIEPDVQSIADALRASTYRTGRRGIKGMDFQAHNGRTFRATTESDGIYLTEVSFDGRVRDEQGNIFLWPRYNEMSRSPNSIKAALLTDKVSPVFEHGDNRYVYSRHFSTVDDAAVAIHDALRQNVFYHSVDSTKKHEFNELRAERLNIAGVFEGLFTTEGPISEKVKDNIFDFLDYPNKFSWGRVADVYIHDTTTLYEMWADEEGHVDYPLDGQWENYPEPARVSNWLRELSLLGIEQTLGGGHKPI